MQGRAANAHVATTFDAMDKMHAEAKAVMQTSAGHDAGASHDGAPAAEAGGKCPFGFGGKGEEAPPPAKAA